MSPSSKASRLLDFDTDTNNAGSATYAGITAAVTANVVLFAYIFVAWRDDQGERAADDKSKEKKAQ